MDASFVIIHLSEIMKFLLAIIGIFGAGVLGYWLEPSLRPILTKTSATTVVEKNHSQPSAETVVAEEAPKLSFDYTKLQPHQLPAKITLKSAATATASGETDALPLPPGTKVKPLRIEGFDVHFSVLGTAQGKIEVKQTDLVEQLIANPPPAAIEETPAPVKTEAEPTTVKEPEVQEEKSVEPVVEPEPAVEPMEEQEPAQEQPAPVATALSADAILQLMQADIRSGKISEFNFSQVQDWKATEEETIDGETYQTGIASYQAETIFGTKSIQAKALIKNGKVVRWIWPTSGLEIQ